MGQDGTVYLRARHYLPQLGRFLQRDTFPDIPERPQSLHRSTYAEHNPVRFTDPTGHAVGPDGQWAPCNLLPGRADTCTAGDFVDWWGTDEPGKVGRFAVTVVNDFASIPAVLLGLPYQLLTDPQGVIWGVLYSPFQFGEDVLVGTLCGDPERLGHATSAYALFVLGGVKQSLEKPVPGMHPPHGRAKGGGAFDGEQTHLYDPPNNLFGQGNEGSCVAASCRMILNNPRIPESYIRTAAHVTEKGGYIQDAPAALRQLEPSLRTHYEPRLSIDQLRSATDRGPAIVSVKTEAMNYGSHALVVDKIDSTMVYIRDPWPPGQGSAYAVSVDTFQAAWSGAAVIHTP